MSHVLARQLITDQIHYIRQGGGLGRPASALVSRLTAELSTALEQQVLEDGQIAELEAALAALGD